MNAREMGTLFSLSSTVHSYHPFAMCSWHLADRGKEWGNQVHLPYEALTSFKESHLFLEGLLWVLIVSVYQQLCYYWWLTIKPYYYDSLTPFTLISVSGIISLLGPYRVWVVHVTQSKNNPLHTATFFLLTSVFFVARAIAA